MKIALRFSAAVFLACMQSGHALADLRIDLTPGSASSHSAEINAAAGAVRLTGRVDARDFAVLNSLPAAVTCLDMSGLAIEARSTAIPDAHGVGMYPAGHIPDYAFFQCTVPEVIFPASATLGEGVLACAQTVSVTLPTGLEEIPALAFYRSGVRDIYGTESVKAVGSYALSGCAAQSLSFPALESGGDYAFAYMQDLAEVVFPPSARLGVGILTGCPLLEKVAASPLDIPPYFASDSRRLNAERLLNESIHVGGYALANIPQSALVLAPGLESMAEGACAGMKGLVMIEANPCGFSVPEVHESTFFGIDPSQVTLYVAKGSAPLWKADPVWGGFKILEQHSSVSAVGADPSGISFGFDGHSVTVTSSSAISLVEVYDSAGALFLSSAPGSDSCRLDVADGIPSGIAVVRAVSLRGEASVRLMIR